LDKNEHIRDLRWNNGKLEYLVRRSTSFDTDPPTHEEEWREVPNAVVKERS
jgi:hypothetical protein